MIARIFPSGALTALVMLASAVPVSAQPKTSDKVVQATATATRPDADGNQVVTITLNITDKKFHLYANPVGNEDFKSNEVQVIIDKVASAKIDYPLGMVKEEKGIGKLNIYKGKVTIKATVKRNKSDTGPLPVAIKVQACDDKRCLLPGTIKLSVP